MESTRLLQSVRSLALTMAFCLLVALMLLWLVLQVEATVAIERDRLQGTTPVGQFEDYVAYYAAGRLILEGDGSHLYDIPRIAAEETEALGRPAGGGVQPFFNPPFVAVVMAPLSAMPLQAFGLVLLAINPTLVLFLGVALDRFLSLPAWRQRACFALGYLSLASTWWVVQEGQLSLFLFLGFLAFVWFERLGRERAAGAALALLLIKPQMLIILIPVLLWRRRWAELKAFAGIATVLALISVIAVGPPHLLDYPRFLLDSTGWEKWGVKIASMYGWNGFLANLTGLNPPPHLLVLLLDAATIAVMCWGVAAKRSWSMQVPQITAAVILASLLLNPHLYFQELSLLPLIIAIGIASNPGRAGVSAWGWVGVGVWLLELYARPNTPLAAPLVLTPVIAALLLLTVWQLRRPGNVEVSTGTESAEPAPVELRTSRRSEYEVSRRAS